MLKADRVRPRSRRVWGADGERSYREVEAKVRRGHGPGDLSPLVLPQLVSYPLAPTEDPDLKE